MSYYRYCTAREIYNAACDGLLHTVSSQSINVKNCRGQTALFIAVMNDNTRAVCRLINHGADINITRSQYGNFTALSLAARERNEHLVKILLRNGARVTCDYLDRILTIAYDCCLIRSIVQNEKYCNKNGCLEDSVLYNAVKLNRKEILDEILSYGVLLDKVNSCNQTMLQVTLARGNTKVAKLLISHGADVNNIDDNDETALIAALKNVECLISNSNTNDSLDVIKLLVEKTADVDQCTKLGITALSAAVSQRNLDIVGLLIQHKADVNRANENGDTPLNKAVKENCTDIVRCLLANGADVNRFGENFEPNTIMAARNLNLEIVKSLMKHNVDLNVEFNGNNALLISVEKNDKPLQTFLIENGAELDTFNSNGESALFMTAKSGNLDLARLLIKHGADVDILNSKKINALYLAVEIDNPEFAKLLVEAKASLDTVFYNGNTTLHLAVKHNRLDMTQVLAQAGAEVNKVNHKGRTPLMYALKFGHLECTKILLQYGGDANIMDYTERTALAFALENRERFYQNVNSFVQSIKAVLEFTKDVNLVYKLRGKKTTILLLSIKLEHFEVFKMILHAVSDIEEADDQGDTPLQAALQLPTDKRVDFVKILLSTGAQVNAANNLGQTPILTTVKNCDLDNTMLLVEAGANLNQRFPEHASGISGTVLHVAVKTKCVEMIKYLATLDFDINLQNQERKTALMLAADLGLSECVVALLKAKADVNIRDAKGCNALAYAINGRSPELNQSNAYLDCVKELLKYSSQVNVQYTIDVRQTTPLIDSIGFENVEYVKLILKAGSDLEMVDGRGRTALMVALRPQNKRRLEFAKYLIQFGANVNVVVKLGETPLGVSIRNRDYELAKLILQSGANVKDLKDNVTCLHESSRQGNVDIVEIMIQMGVDVNSTDKLGQTAVMVAGNTECLSILIKAGCDVNKTDNKGRNAVMLASRDLKVGNLKVLITSGADVNARSHKGKTVLFYLIKTNNILRWEKFNEAVEILLNANVNVDVTRESGDTILMVIAANYESFFKRSFGKFNHNFSQRLIDKSSDVNIQNHKLETVMHLCVKNNLLDLTYELIKKGFRMDMKDADGNTPLVFGVRKFEMTKALLDAGANPNIVNGSGKTPLMLAAEDDDVDETVVNLLVEHKANLNLPDSKGNTSLMLAVERCNVNKIQILLDAGAEVIHRKGFGAHAWAVCLARNYNSQQLNLMLKAGADITGVNEQGETGLMLAVKHSRTEAIQFFMGAGDLDKQDNRGRSALMYTRDVSIQKILLEAGASINLQDYKGKSCFMKMVEKGDTNIETYVELYISYGLNMNIKDYTNRTALFYAFRAKSPLFMTNVMFLLKNNISPVIKINSSEFKTIVYDKIISETFSTAIFSNKIEILRFIICNGFFILFNGSSLLCQALNIDNTDIIKYCLANCYLNLEDLKLLKEKEESIPSSIKPALSAPWPLVKLALITVSSHMGYGAERIERVKRSELPIDLQDALLFNTPVARLPTSQWSSIPINFDPKLYDDLETPRP